MKKQLFKDLKESMFKYNDELAKKLAEESINEKINPLETVGVLTKSIAKIGEEFEKGDLWLPDLMMAANTMKHAMGPLDEEIKKKGLHKETVGKVVIGTVYGDLHDIGKGMVSTMLNANGFEVIDIGINVDSKKFIEAIKKHKPNILAMSALLTTTAPEQERVIKALKDSGIRNQIKVIVGGGSITQEFADRIGADGYEPTAPLAVKLAKKLADIN